MSALHGAVCHLQITKRCLKQESLSSQADAECQALYLQECQWHFNRFVAQYEFRFLHAQIEDKSALNSLTIIICVQCEDLSLNVFTPFSGFCSLRGSREEVAHILPNHHQRCDCGAIHINGDQRKINVQRGLGALNFIKGRVEPDSCQRGAPLTNVEGLVHW